MKIAVNGVTRDMTPEEVSAYNAENERVKVEKLATKYIRDRQSAYPPLAEQLDKIYHEGIDAWKADITAIKDKYPKPE